MWVLISSVAVFFRSSCRLNCCHIKIELSFSVKKKGKNRHLSASLCVWARQCIADVFSLCSPRAYCRLTYSNQQRSLETLIRIKYLMRVKLNIKAHSREDVLTFYTFAIDIFNDLMETRYTYLCFVFCSNSPKQWIL